MKHELSKELLQKIIETADEIITVNDGTNEDISKNDTNAIIGLYDHFNDNLASPSVVKALAAFALAAREQEPVSFDELRDAVAEMTGSRPMQWREGDHKGHQVVSFINFNSLSRIVEKFRTHPAPSIPAAVPDGVSGPLEHAYKELTPTFMRNHIAVFERYGITPNDGSTVIQALRIALDGMERRAAMLQSDDGRDYRGIVERIAEIMHGSVTDVDLLTVTVLSMKQKTESIHYDTRRLDWLDAQNKRLNEYHGTTYGWRFDANFQRNAMILNDSNCCPVMTVREAIDAAMPAAPKGV